MNEAKEDVLGADVGMVEEARFFLRQYDYSPSSIGKAFEQFDRPYLVPFWHWNTCSKCTGTVRAGRTVRRNLQLCQRPHLS